MCFSITKEKYKSLNAQSMIWAPSKPRQIPKDIRQENVCLLWERKGEQFLGFQLERERHLACEVRFSWVYAYLSHGPPYKAYVELFLLKDTKSAMSFLE